MSENGIEIREDGEVRCADLVVGHISFDVVMPSELAGFYVLDTGSNQDLISMVDQIGDDLEAIQNNLKDAMDLAEDIMAELSGPE